MPSAHISKPGQAWRFYSSKHGLSFKPTLAIPTLQRCRAFPDGATPRVGPAMYGGAGASPEGEDAVYRVRPDDLRR